MPTLDCYAARLRKNIADPAEAHDLQRDLPGGVAARAARPSASRRFEWSQHDVFTIPHWTWASHEASGGDADLFIVSDKSAFERSTCCARNAIIRVPGVCEAPPSEIRDSRELRCARCGQLRCTASRKTRWPRKASRPHRRRRHRRVAAPRRGPALPARPRPLRRRHRAAGRACTACSCARRTPMPASAGSMRRPQPPRPASSPCSPAPTWRPTASAADAAALGHPLARRQADGRAAALCAGARHRAPCRRAGGGGDRRDARRRRRTPPSVSRSTTSRSRRSPSARRAGGEARRSCMRPRPGNVCFRWARGDEAAVREGVSTAPHMSSRSISSTTA